MISGREDIRKWRENIYREFWEKGKKKTLWEKYILKTLLTKEKYMQSKNGEILLSAQARS